MQAGQCASAGEAVEGDEPRDGNAAGERAQARADSAMEFEFSALGARDHAGVARLGPRAGGRAPCRAGLFFRRAAPEIKQPRCARSTATHSRPRNTGSVEGGYAVLGRLLLALESAPPGARGADERRGVWRPGRRPRPEPGRVAAGRQGPGARI